MLLSFVSFSHKMFSKQMQAQYFILIGFWFNTAGNTFLNKKV